MKPALYRVSVRLPNGTLRHYTVEAAGGGVAARKVGDETGLRVINVERIADASSSPTDSTQLARRETPRAGGGPDGAPQDHAARTLPDESETP